MAELIDWDDKITLDKIERAHRRAFIDTLEQIANTVWVDPTVPAWLDTHASALTRRQRRRLLKAYDRFLAAANDYRIDVRRIAVELATELAQKGVNR